MTRIRQLCVDVCDDGLRCAPDWPHCIDAEDCIARERCFWRAFHQIPADQLRADRTPRQRELFE